MAKLAGVPAETVRRARDYLARLDKFNARGRGAARPVRADRRRGAGDPDAPAASPDADAVAAQLAALDPDAMTPRDALAALYELRKLLDALG